MQLSNLKDSLPGRALAAMSRAGISVLRPAQEKAVAAGLLTGENLLVCTPTASGKTLIAEMAAVQAILRHKGKAVYIVPLVALASEKAREFKRRYGTLFSVALSVGDLDSADPRLGDHDLIVCTSEKLDSLIRHHAPWLSQVRVIIVDEVHLLNDVSRGPTMEILLTVMRSLLSDAQILALSATIGNPQELARWLGASLIEDSWRPVPLHKGVYLGGEIAFED